MPVSLSGVMLGAFTCPGSPSSGNIRPCPRPAAITGPPSREKSRSEWHPSQSSSVTNRYCPRSILSGVIATVIFEGGALEGRRSS